MVNVLIGVYILGVAIGLVVMRDRWPVRLVTALAWPLGILAFVVVTAILLAAAVYLWPVTALIAIAVLVAIFLAI